MQKILIVLLFFVIFAPIAVYANVNEQEASSDSTVIKIEYKSMFLSAVSWPFVNFIQPAAEFLMYPIIPPLIYVSRENLIDKGQRLITYGDSGQIMFYPLVNAKVGSQASTGFMYRHANLIYDDDYMVFSPHLYISRDWDFAASYRKSKIIESSLFMDLGIKYKEMGSNSFRDPYTTTYFFADSSLFLLSTIGFSLIDDWNLSFTLETNFHRFDFPNLDEEIFDNLGVLDRGFYQNFNSFPLGLSMFYNTLDAPYAATKGSKFSIGYVYVPVTSYNNSKDHNYHVLDSRYVHYFLLGKKSYAMTVTESEASRERFKNLTFKEALEIFNPMNVKEEVLDRRVLITQLKARYMMEESKGKAPFTAMGGLGESFPLRAYSGGYFNAPLVAGFSAEYRWPIDIYADALIFNEYGIYGYDLKNTPLSNLKNSYGLGFRIRTPKLFIARFALAFHGLHGISFILTTRPEYD